MIKLFRKLLGLPVADIDHLLEEGASILDVRTATEFKRGHIPGALNIPYEEVGKRIREIKKLQQPVITCCRRGWRSDIASRALRKLGLEVYHGGKWNKLAQRMEKLNSQAIPFRKKEPAGAVV